MSETELLYDHLPAVYRLRDAERGYPLRALLGLIAGELARIDHDVDQLYDDSFIETCADWAVEYIGDLVGARPLAAGAPARRSYVANTIAYRRRKGTALVLEQLARDVTGWPARAVEFFTRLAVTQHMRDIRPGRGAVADVRGAGRDGPAGGPFSSANHTAEFRSPARGGRFNIPHIGLFLWRLQSYPVHQSDARGVGAAGCPHYTFSPLGADSPLFNDPGADDDLERLALEPDVPGLLRREALADDLETLRAAIAADAGPAQLAAAAARLASPFFGPQPTLGIVRDGVQIPPEQIAVADLTHWGLAPPSRSYRGPGGAAISLPIAAMVDPVLGRIVLPGGRPPARLQVSYAYGFAGDLGAGPYDRSESLARWLAPRLVTWSAIVARGGLSGPGRFTSFALAIDAWRAHAAAHPGACGLIAIADSASYTAGLTGAQAIPLPAGSRLLIAGAELGDDGLPVATAQRPHLNGDLELRAGAATRDENRGELLINGLLLEGALRVSPGDLGALHVAHCTLVPDAGGLEVLAGAAGANSALAVRLERSICGPVRLPPGATLHAAASILDGDAGGGPSIGAAGSDCTLQAVTALGAVTARTLHADTTIFAGDLTVARRQVGCLRFCYVAAGTLTPRRYRCQPDLALERAAQALGRAGVAALTPAERAQVVARVRPAFAGRALHEPWYGQLARTCAAEIGVGAEDGAEMGAFNFLKAALREASLRQLLDEYLRFGLDAGIFFAT